MIELTFLKELILIRQVEQKSVITCHYWHFLNKRLKLQPDDCNGWHDVYKP